MSKKNKYCVYFHFRLDNSQLFYVGYGVKKRSHDNNSRNKDWIKVVDESGGYYVEIFENNLFLPLEEALNWETYFISRYGRQGFDENGILVNKSIGGKMGAEGSTHKQPLWLTKKLTQIHKGKIVSQDTKDKISNSRKGIKFTDEQKIKISNNKKGHTCYNNEWRNKISIGQKGKPKSTNKPIYQLDLDGNIIKEWRSISEAKLIINDNKGDGIGGCCRGKQQTAYGYKWVFKDKYEKEKNT